VFFVFSYILFEVLDLDGSNFPKLLTPVERSIIAAEEFSEARLDDSLKPATLLDNVLSSSVAQSVEYLRFKQPVSLRFSPLGSVRAHGYRTCLARDSLPHSSPYV
jgi:hypothetical protein